MAYIPTQHTAYTYVARIAFALITPCLTLSGLYGSEPQLALAKTIWATECPYRITYASRWDNLLQHWQDSFHLREQEESCWLEHTQFPLARIPIKPGAKRKKVATWEIDIDQCNWQELSKAAFIVHDMRFGVRSYALAGVTLPDIVAGSGIAFALGSQLIAFHGCFYAQNALEGIVDAWASGFLMTSALYTCLWTREHLPHKSSISKVIQNCFAEKYKVPALLYVANGPHATRSSSHAATSV